MARISLDPPRTPLFRFIEWYSKRSFGKVLDPGKALAHSPRVLRTYFRMEQGVTKWHALDRDLSALAVLAAATRLDCSWCMDFGYWENRERGMSAEKLRAVPGWRESGVYSPTERDVMAYAEAMTTTPVTVDDELADRLRTRLGEAAFVDLTAVVAVENMRSRLNLALGLVSQGFKETCDLRDAPTAGGH
ncbi:carboxymuconolactone decarboxylase family protein [Streptomyces sp. NA04227]|uniref:carboxymuconolactone decarboxylase family protein n=1 Tax=Streptomyces sp. NA04227 TaxID=2742136 RepID=UPI00158FC56E|nr:carboxymuconolactone decarboxylase family protein [Streptomyces sp. NA04227]QKW10249.1 carboxymuconolactone decarboxylase family protein [Streptomyces sp. NA04227]